MGGHREQLLEGVGAVVRSWARIAFLIGAVLLAGVAPASQETIAAIEAGNALAARLHYSAAIEAYQAAAVRCPGSPLPHLRQGTVYLKQARYADALHAYLEAARLGGLDGEVLEGLARLYAARGSNEAAAGAFASLLRHRPGRGDLWFQLGEAREASGDVAGAREAYLRALEAGQPALAPVDVQQAHARLGMLCLREDEAACAAHWRSAAEGPDVALGVQAAAITAALGMLESGSEPAYAWAKLGEALLDYGELQEARHALERALALAPAYAGAHAYLGHVLSMLGEEEGAVAHLEEAIELAPGDALAYYFLGMHYVRLGRLITGRSVLLEGHDAAPTDPAICAAVADTYLRAERIDYGAAERWLHAAVDRAPEEVRFHLLLAHFYVDHNLDPGLHGVAVAQYALELAPDDVEALETLGWGYVMAGRAQEALEPLLRARALAPERALVYFRLGAAYEALGEGHLARDAYQQAVDLDWGGAVGERARAALADMGQ